MEQDTLKEGLIDFFSFTGDTQLLWHHFNDLKALERQYKIMVKSVNIGAQMLIKIQALNKLTYVPL